MVSNIYIREDTSNMDYIQEEIVKKIKTTNNYIYWANIRNLLTKSLIIVDQNLTNLQ